MPIWQSYYLAKSIPDALERLAAAPGPARLVAGGTDLLLDLQQGRHPPVHTLVDVTEIPDLNALEIRMGGLFIGAAVPHYRLVASELIAMHAEALLEACGLIGGPQVRNTATLGGNVAHALPAADGAIALLALGAKAEVASLQERQILPLLDLYQGPGRSTLNPQKQLLVGFHLPLINLYQASAFRRVMRPQGVALPILNLACWLARHEDVIQDIRISVGPAGPIPFCASCVEDILRGKFFEAENLTAATDALLNTAQFRTSPNRATVGYRREIAQVLLQDTVKAAWERAGSNH